MNEIIKPHSFESAKQHIQTFSDKAAENLPLNKVDVSGGLFNLFDHKVTGAELNSITSQIQNHLIRSNNLHVDLIREFGQVYKALESLDEEYIPAILSAVKGAETASDQAKAAQNDIKKTIEAQKKIINVLENHKAKLDQLKYLSNIDQIWTDTQNLQKKIIASQKEFSDVKNQLDILRQGLEAVKKHADEILGYEHLKDIDETWDTVEKLCETVHIISGILDKIEKQEHLYEIDSIWSNARNDHVAIETLQKATSNLAQKDDVLAERQKELAAFREKLESQEHVFDIDLLWANMDSALAEHKNSILQTKKQIITLKRALDEEKELHRLTIDKLKKQLSIVYFVVGSAIGLGFLELLLNLAGVL